MYGSPGVHEEREKTVGIRKDTIICSGVDMMAGTFYLKKENDLHRFIVTLLYCITSSLDENIKFLS